MINSTNIEKATFLIESVPESESVKVHTNRLSLYKFLNKLNCAIENPSSYPVIVESTPIPEQYPGPARILLERLIILQANSSQMQPGASSLSFEWDQDQNVVEIRSDCTGIESLRDTCTWLVDRSGMDHEHLMVPEWGGDELSEMCFNPDYVPVKHVKILKWESELE